MAELEATLYEIRNGAAWITLNRPRNRNALSAVLVSELYDHLLAANEDPAARSIVVTGTDPAFCAGADLKSPPGASIDGRRSVPYPQVLTTIMESPKPVIAAVNGAAFAGGLGLVGASDIVVAAEEVQFSFSEVRIGVIPAVISVVTCPSSAGITPCACSSLARDSPAPKRWRWVLRIAQSLEVNSKLL